MKKSELRKMIKEELLKEELDDRALRAASDHMSDVEQSMSALFKIQVFMEDPKFRNLVKKVYGGQWKDVISYFSDKYQ